MKRILDKCLLLLYGLLILTHQELTSLYILAFFIALSLSAFQYARENHPAIWISAFIYMILAILTPGFAVFLPLILYEMLLSNHKPLAISAGVLCALAIARLPLFPMLYTILGCGIAFLFQYSTTRNEALTEQLKRIRDDSWENQLLLKSQNQSLLDRQDQEIYTATLKERNRIAREIHDNVGHMLSRSILMTGALKAVNQNDSLDDMLSQLELTLSDSMTTIRQSVHNLHDDSIDLQAAIQNLIAQREHCPATLIYDMQREVPSEIKYSYISIIKEALANVMKHSNAEQIEIIVREHPALYQLIIHDNGTNITFPEQKGIGLVNMHDRVQALGGTIKIDTEKGFRIFIMIPKAC